MRRCLAAICLFVAATAASAQAPSRVYTHTSLPEKPVLDRAGVKLGWSITLPMDGRRDGLASLQVIPITVPSGSATRELGLVVVQMRSGTLALYDGETGDKYWSHQPGRPYPPVLPDVTINDDTIVVIREFQIMGFELFDVNDKKVPTALKREARQRWSFTMAAMPTTGPVANGNRVVVGLNGTRLTGYEHGYTETWKSRYSGEFAFRASRGEYPDYTRWQTPEVKHTLTPSLVAVRTVFGPDYGTIREKRDPEPSAPSLTVVANLLRTNELASTSEMSSTPSVTVVNSLSRVNELSRRDLPPPKLEERWASELGFRAFQTPYVFYTYSLDPNNPGRGVVEPRMVVVGSEREIRTYGFTGVAHYEIGKDVFRSNISAPVAQMGVGLYVPTYDGTIYALQADRGLILWQSNIQGVPITKPAAISSDVFVTSKQGKMFRLNADDGLAPKPQDGLFAADGSYAAVNVKQFLAASDRTVFAIDPVDRLLVLDRKRGTLRGRVDMTGYTYAHLNDTSDRVYMASNDGRLICLHDPVQVKPQLHRLSVHTKYVAPGAAAPAADPAKPAEGK